MHTKMGPTLLFFGCDAKTMTGDEFFGIFNQFLVSFTEAKNENAALKKQKENEEKKEKEKKEKEKKEKEKRSILSKRASLPPELKKASRQILSEKRASLQLEGKPTVQSDDECCESGPEDTDDLLSALCPHHGDIFGDKTQQRSPRTARKSKVRRSGSVVAPCMEGGRDRSHPVLDKLELS